MTKCDLCKGNVPRSDKKQVEIRGDVAFKVWCEACDSSGPFIMTTPAIKLLDRAKKGSAKRNRLIAHFRQFIASKRSAGREAVITDDLVEKYWHVTDDDVQRYTPRKGLKANYQGATPEQVGKAVLRYRPGKKKDE